MILFKKAADIAGYIDRERQKGNSIGFAPTMGALHAGHLSLVDAAKKQNSLAICSIFVNPTQFNDPKDLEKYPVTLEKDIDMLERAGCDVLFIPTVAEVYPNGTAPGQRYELGFLETVLEGKYRPGHFQGVCQVVHRLLQIVQPDSLYLGQKDYQQCMVIKKLVQLLGMDIQVVVCPTLREKDGLAMSSRNMRLDEQERELAVNISAILSAVKKDIRPGSLDEIKEKAKQQLSAKGFMVDYVEIAAASTLETQHDWNGDTKLVALAAAYLNGIRLIDNMLLN